MEHSRVAIEGQFCYREQRLGYVTNLPVRFDREAVSSNTTNMEDRIHFLIRLDAGVVRSRSKFLSSVTTVRESSDESIWWTC